MGELKIRSSNITPQVYFQLDENRLEIRGRCYPENPEKFFTPLLIWFENHFQDHSINTTFEVYLEYFNTGSYIQLLGLFNLLAKKNKEGHTIDVKWFLEDNDEDAMDNGRSIQEVVDLPFQICTLPNINYKGEL